MCPPTTNTTTTTTTTTYPQAGLTFRAVLLNIYLHQWERALDLAVKVTHWQAAEVILY